MAKIRKGKVWQASGCLISIVVLWARLDSLGASEFRGGSLTGPLFALAELSSLLFLVALLLTFFLRRLSATIALAGTLFCLPLYLYFLMPGPYRWVFGGEFSVPLRGSLRWNTWAVVGTLSLVFAAISSLRSYHSAQADTPPSNRDVPMKARSERGRTK
jgi:hypothetical protein